MLQDLTERKYESRSDLLRLKQYLGGLQGAHEEKLEILSDKIDTFLHNARITWKLGILSKRSEAEHLAKIAQEETNHKAHQDKLRLMLEGKEEEKFENMDFLKTELDQMIRLKEAVLLSKTEQIVRKNPPLSRAASADCESSDSGSLGTQKELNSV